MVKKNFIDVIQTKVNEVTGEEYSKRVCGDMLDAVTSAIAEVLTSGDTIRIDGLGTFSTRFQAGREVFLLSMVRSGRPQTHLFRRLSLVAL